MNDQIKINNLAKNFGVSLIKTGQSILRSAFKLNPVLYKKIDIINFLADNYGFKPVDQFSLADDIYYVEKIAVWRNIIEVDWGSTKDVSYKADLKDCDNYAYSFASRINEIFEINTCGVCHGSVFDAKTKRGLGGHAFNLILALDENNKLKPYVFEPMFLLLTEWKKGQDNILKDWIYLIRWFILY